MIMQLFCLNEKVKNFSITFNDKNFYFYILR